MSESLEYFGKYYRAMWLELGIGNGKTRQVKNMGITFFMQAGRALINSIEKEIRESGEKKRPVAEPQPLQAVPVKRKRPAKTSPEFLDRLNPDLPQGQSLLQAQEPTQEPEPEAESGQQKQPEENGMEPAAPPAEMTTEEALEFIGSHSIKKCEEVLTAEIAAECYIVTFGESPGELSLRQMVAKIKKA